MYHHYDWSQYKFFTWNMGFFLNSSILDFKTSSRFHDSKYSSSKSSKLSRRHTWQAIENYIKFQSFIKLSLENSPRRGRPEILPKCLWPTVWRLDESFPTPCLLCYAGPWAICTRRETLQRIGCKHPPQADSVSGNCERSLINQLLWFKNNSDWFLTCWLTLQWSGFLDQSGPRLLDETCSTVM